MSAFWDILPTIQELIGDSRKENSDGISFLPTLLNSGKQDKHDYLYWEFHEDGGRQAVRYKNFKLIKFNVKDSKKSYYELYDLNEDPQERNPIQNKRIFQVMEKMLQEAHVESLIFPLLV